MQGFTRQKMVHNLTTARTIGIAFNLTDQGTLDEVLSLMDSFEELNIRAYALAYFDAKETPQYFSMHTRVDIIDKSRVNWYGKPESTVADSFMAKEFDILIDFNFHESLPMRWIATLSKARFKVGALNYFSNPFDLIVTVDHSKGLNYLGQQMYDILYQLNNRFAQESATM